jgi:hypothetical protein
MIKRHLINGFKTNNNRMLKLVVRGKKLKRKTKANNQRPEKPKNRNQSQNQNPNPKKLDKYLKLVF